MPHPADRFDMEVSVSLFLFLIFFTSFTENFCWRRAVPVRMVFLLMDTSGYGTAPVLGYSILLG